MIVSTTIGGIPVELFLVDPDWKKNFNMEATIPVDSTMGQTGQEERHPESLHPRFKISFTPDWKQTDSEDIVTLAATIGTKRIAMPVFADTRSAISDTFIFSGQHYVSWNDAGQWVIDADTYDYVAPLVFGYLESNSFNAITDVIGQTSITFIEDAPYSHRLSIVDTTVTEDFTLDPEPKSVKTTLKSPLIRDDIGRGREKALGRQEDVFRYELESSFKLFGQTEITYFLSFWNQKKGRWKSFNVPAFFQPATNTPDTPDAYRARFRGETLKISFKKPDVAIVNPGFIQAPWELNGDAADFEKDPKCYAFEFQFDIPGKSSLYFIDWESSVTIDSNVHNPYKMTVNGLSMGSRLFKEEATLVYEHASDNPLLAFVEGGLERNVSLIVKEGDPQVPASFTTVFVGTLQSLKGKERKLSATFSPFGGLFNRRLPGFKIQHHCNYRFCNANCKLSISSFKSEAASIDSADLSNEGYTVRCNSLTGTLTNPTDPGAGTGDRFANGYLEIGTGDDYQIRMIKKTTVHAGTDRSFDLNRPLDSSKLDNSDGNIDVYAGCGGTKWECEFYNNYVNFGGHPFVPDKLDTVNGQRPKAGK